MDLYTYSACNINIVTSSCVHTVSLHKQTRGPEDIISRPPSASSGIPYGLFMASIPVMLLPSRICHNPMLSSLATAIHKPSNHKLPQIK